MKRLRKIKSPGALAALGAFFVPEPFGAFVVLAAAVWWLYRKFIRYRARRESVPALLPAANAEPLASTAPVSLAA
jgi:hypothetical protein